MIGDKGYHGDGIYSEDLGDMIKTWTPREHGEHLIYYGPRELWDFLVSLRKYGWLNDDMLERLRALPTPEEKIADDLGGLENSTDEEEDSEA